MYGDGTQAYDFVYVGDCAHANVCAMKADTVDRFYNVGTGVRTSIKELVALVLEVTGSDAGIRYEPAGLTFVKNRIGSPERAAAELGFKAQVQLARDCGSRSSGAGAPEGPRTSQSRAVARR